MRLISKKSVLRILQEEPSYYDTQNAITEIYDKINELPTIEERKTGRWEFVSYGDGLGNYHCSECRAIASSYLVGNLVNRHWEYKLTKYCGGCGAKMEGAEEDDG